MANSKILLEKKYTTFKLFDRALSYDSEAEIMGNMILQGEEKEVEEVINKIKEQPILMHCKVVATDPLGTKVHGTLLQIAAMAGDFNLRSNIENEKDRGLVERLIAAGNLSHDEVVEQLQCINSKKAKQENEKRNQRYLKIIKKFVLAEIEANQHEYGYYVRAFQAPIDTLEKDLQNERRKEISAGFIFDPKILQAVVKWCGYIGSNAFWVNCFGKLQSKLSSRDAQVVSAGIGRGMDGDQIPDRTLNNASGESYFYNKTSGLGRDFYLGYNGPTTRSNDYGAIFVDLLPACIGRFISRKNHSIKELVQSPDHKSRFERFCSMVR